MTYTILEPEVAGGWGDRTIADTSQHPPVVHRFHYEFEGWLGDDILESFPCFIVSDRLAAELKRSGLRGFELDDVHITTGPVFEESRPGVRLPTFRWLKVTGTPGLDDFGIGADHRLVVSSEALILLERFGLDHADRAPYSNGTG